MTESIPQSPQQALQWTRELTGSGGAGIADLAGYKNDLDMVDDACRRILSLKRQAPVDNELIDIIWTAAVVNYARYHSRGARQPLSKDLLEALSPVAIATHDRLIAVRDKHIAHSVNSMETNLAIYELSDPDSGSKRIVRIGTLQMRREWDHAAEATALIQLSAELRAMLLAVTKSFHDMVMKQLMAMNMNELYAEPSMLLKHVERGSSLTETRKGPDRRGPNAPVVLA